MDDELVTNFMAVTGSDAQTAEHYLAANNHDLEGAITLFFETGGASIQSQQGLGGGGTGTGTGGAGNNDSDAELSRRLQEEEYAARGNAEPEVREAIARRTEVLVDPYMPRGPPAPVDRPRNVFEDSSDENDEDDEEEEDVDGYMRASGYRARRRSARLSSGRLASASPDTGTDTGTGGSSSRLSRMFKPPYDLITNLAFDDAKSLGQSRHTWLLVNIQAADEFACQVLNRDIWSNARVHTAVADNFIFLQYDSDSDEGAMFRNYYPFEEYPYICIIDPRTGEQVRSWTPSAPTSGSTSSRTPTDPAEFTRELKDFLAQYSLDPARSKANPVGNVGKRRPKDVALMTEEDQIEYALRQSLGKISDDEEVGGDGEGEGSGEGYDEEAERLMVYDSDVSGDFYDDEDEDDEVQDNESEQEAEDPEPEPEAEAEAEEPDADDDEELTEEDRFALIRPCTDPEPDMGPTVTRVQLRLADGTRLVRRVHLADTVRTLFAIVKHVVPAARYSFFALTSERKKLGEMMDLTIEEAGLKNSSILVDILD